MKRVKTSHFAAASRAIAPAPVLDLSLVDALRWSRDLAIFFARNNNALAPNVDIEAALHASPKADNDTAGGDGKGEKDGGNGEAESGRGKSDSGDSGGARRKQTDVKLMYSDAGQMNVVIGQGGAGKIVTYGTDALYRVEQVEAVSKDNAGPSLGEALRDTAINLHEALREGRAQDFLVTLDSLPQAEAKAVLDHGVADTGQKWIAAASELLPHDALSMAIIVALVEKAAPAASAEVLMQGEGWAAPLLTQYIEAVTTTDGAQALAASLPLADLVATPVLAETILAQLPDDTSRARTLLAAVPELNTEDARAIDTLATTLVNDTVETGAGTLTLSHISALYPEAGAVVAVQDGAAFRTTMTQAEYKSLRDTLAPSADWARAEDKLIRRADIAAVIAEGPATQVWLKDMCVPLEVRKPEAKLTAGLRAVLPGVKLNLDKVYSLQVEKTGVARLDTGQGWVEIKQCHAVRAALKARSWIEAGAKFLINPVTTIAARADAMLGREALLTLVTPSGTRTLDVAPERAATVVRAVAAEKDFITAGTRDAPVALRRDAIIARTTNDAGQQVVSSVVGEVAVPPVRETVNLTRLSEGKSVDLNQVSVITREPEKRTIILHSDNVSTPLTFKTATGYQAAVKELEKSPRFIGIGDSKTWVASLDVRRVRFDGTRVALMVGKRNFTAILPALAGQTLVTRLRDSRKTQRLAGITNTLARSVMKAMFAKAAAVKPQAKPAAGVIQRAGLTFRI